MIGDEHDWREVDADSSCGYLIRVPIQLRL